MKIALITTHNFPVPYKTHTGEIVIKDLAQSLSEIGHEVYFVAPAGSFVPDNGYLLEMPCGWGKYPPTSEDCERQCFERYCDVFRSVDIVHDFSNSKVIVKTLINQGKNNTITTFLGGNWNQADGVKNICVWSEAMKKRALIGATDYWNTPDADKGGPSHKPIKDARVVYGGVDTNFYTPTYNKKNYFLWMNRWHHVKGYKEAIKLAQETNIELVLAGENPDNELFEYQKNCALEAVELSKNLSNVHIEFLPSDPNHHTAKRKLYQEAKALLYPVQFNEPFGLSQVESLACGTPLITTGYGSMPEIISDGLTGYVRPNTINDLASAIDVIDKIVPIDCRYEAVKRFDRKIMAQSYLEKYQEVLSGKGWG